MKIIKTTDRSKIRKDFTATFKILIEACGKDALRRFDGKRFTGRIGYTAFEIIAIGIAKNINSILKRPNPTEYVKSRIEKVWADEHPEKLVYGGMRGTTRISRTLPFGSSWFKDG